MFETSKLPDLQEKSASGSVASFDTILTKPLVSCNIDVNAWQEGSGDPYPAGSTAQRWNEEWEKGSIDVTNGNNVTDNNAIRSVNYIPVLPERSYFVKCGNYPNTKDFRARFYDIDYNYIGSSQYGGGDVKCNSIFKTPTGCYYMRHASTTDYGVSYLNDISINYPETDTSYHKYTNERPIHGFSEVNATRAGKNLFDKSKGKISIANPRFIAFGVDRFEDTIPNGSLWLKAGNYVFSVSGENSTLWESFGIFDISGTRIFVSYNKKFVDFTIPNSGAYKFSMSIKSENFVSWDNYDMQLEAGSTATEYEPYVTPTIYAIQLGQDVYGAEVDAVNGVAHVTHGYREFDGTEGWVATTVSGFPCFQIARGVLPTSAQFISNYIKRVVAMTASEFIGYVDDSNFNVRFTSDTLLPEFKKVLSFNNMQIVYELATPFDIQLTPTQIETLIGNNTIFADTGDVDITYKDCDLAKRGDFRQVFKIPD